jgi:hypothetical protein
MVRWRVGREVRTEAEMEGEAGRKEERKRVMKTDDKTTP